MKKNIGPYVYVGPSIVYIVLFFFIPLIEVVIFSFYDIPMMGRVGDYIGLENYQAVLDSARFQHSLKLTTIWTLSSVLLCILVGLGMALALNEAFPGRKIVRALILIPWLIPASISSIMWRWAFHPSFGIINYTLLSLGIVDKTVPFLTDPNILLFTLILVRVWRGAPFAIFAFLSGLQAIPPVVYEASKVDGASRFQRFLHITLPMLKPILAMVVTLLTIWTFQLFEIIYVLTGGGPYGMTETFPIFLYLSIFSRVQVGLANAAAVIVVIVMLLACYFYFRWFGRK